MRVAVVGAGTAGPAAALFLARSGHHVDIFERVADPQPVGAGILLQPTGQRVLGELGLLNGIVGRGARIDALYGQNLRGRRVIELAYRDLGGEQALCGYGVHRGSLFAALFGALHPAGVAVHTGVEVDEVASDGSVVIRGERHVYDLVIVADGARSHLRPAWSRVTPYPWGALWYVTTDPALAASNQLFQVYQDTRRFIGFLPSGERPDRPGVPTTSVFWSIRADAVDGWRARGDAAWIDDMRRMRPDLPTDGVHDAVFAPYFSVRTRPACHGRVVWLGDSAHAMSPQLGQGANLALWDAWMLAEGLREAGAAQVPDALGAYSRSRRAHVDFYQFFSWLLTPFFQSTLPLLAPLRDLVAGPLHAWGWYRRQMAMTLCGVKTGPFSRILLP